MAATIQVVIKGNESGAPLRSGSPVRLTLDQNGTFVGSATTGEHKLSFPTYTAGANDVLTVTIEPFAG